MKMIYAPLDFSPSTDAVLAAAGELARAGSARVALAHVIQTPMVWDQYASVIDDAARQERTKVDEQLGHAAAGLAADGVGAETRVLYGSPGAGIVEDARACGADYIILGSQGHGALHHLLLGSTTTHVLKHAACPVLVIPVGGSFHALEMKVRSAAGAA